MTGAAAVSTVSILPTTTLATSILNPQEKKLDEIPYCLSWQDPSKIPSSDEGNAWYNTLDDNAYLCAKIDGILRWISFAGPAA